MASPTTTMMKCRSLEWTHRAFLLLIAFAAASASFACRQPEPNVEEALRVVDVVTGWFDAGIVNGQNKLVPTISFYVKNVGDRPISGIDLNAVFRVVGDHEQLGDQFVRGIDRGGLKPAGTVGPFVLRSRLGYTGQQARLEMLQHSQFRDAMVELFAKQASRQWVKLTEFKIQRQLLTR